MKLLTKIRAAFSGKRQCSGSTLVPIGTTLKHGTVKGYQFMNGERYYFIIGAGGSVGYMPSDVIEKEYQSNDLADQRGL